MVDHSNMKLGKKTARRDERIPMFSLYTAQLPSPPNEVDWTNSIIDWGMLANDRLGDCTAAGCGHAIQTWTASAALAVEPVSEDETVAFYAASCGYVPGDPSTDQGGVETDVLTYWLNNDFGGHKIDALANIRPGSLDDIYNSIFLLGGVYLGVELPVSAQRQARWMVPPGGPVGDGAVGSWGGHCIWANRYDRNTNTISCVTWGAMKDMDVEFFLTYCSEGHGILSKMWIEAEGHSPSGFDYSTLVADMVALQS